MKKWTYNIAFKTLCILLAALCLVIAVVSGTAIAVMVEKGAYEEGTTYEDLYKEQLEHYYSWLPYEIASNYDLYTKGEMQRFQDWLRSASKEYGFDCSIYDENGALLYTYATGSESDYVFTLEECVNVGGYWSETVEKPDFSDLDLDYQYYTQINYLVSVHAKEPNLSGNTELSLWLLNVAFRFRFIAIAALCLSLAAFAILMVFLCCAAGLSGEDKEIRENFFDRLYLELYVFAGFFFLLFQFWLIQCVGPLWLVLLVVMLSLVADSLLLVLLTLTLATRIKGGSFFRHTATYRLFSLLRVLMEQIRLVPKVVLILSGVAVFDLFLATLLEFTEFLAAVLVEGLVLMGILVWYAASIQRLFRDQEELSRGNLDHRCDPSRLPPGLRSFGESLNRSAEGMERAVAEKMKSERFKTELITNVSHDIKTPLTSIVNYVDLMKKEETGNPRIREYLEVLDRQSCRLKKLTEDLVESSKAASGVLPVELAPMDVRVLLQQALAEYEAGFEEKGLTLCTAWPETPVFILADGKRLWRVLDNLMNNVCKYALSGTRVYCTLEEEKEKVKVIFRNISHSALNISGDELMERFVRGDASRNTEGSGLGLAIARSLVELQKGTMEIFVDGDLFRVTISFDSIR
ncbi:MAG: HAMP domain-containing histidine kinase [Clostridia bacterium]|nr:HAMP domain-containing histidine kinase [Clostridia bacterium]